MALSEQPLFILAGGTDYYPARAGKPLDDDILDISCITELRKISEKEDHFYIYRALSLLLHLPAHSPKFSRPQAAGHLTKK